MHYMIADADGLALHVNAYRAHGISFRWALVYWTLKNQRRFLKQKKQIRNQVETAKYLQN